MTALVPRLYFLVFLAQFCIAAETPTRIEAHPGRLRQEFQGLGCGAIFYEGHITSLAARQKDDRQKELYDDLFAKVPTQFLQLMIRHDHEPQNDDADPWKQSFDPANFKYCEHTLAIAKAAKERRPDIQLFATLYTPPPWMKTNNSESGGGQSKATIKPKMELEVAEFLWAFLAHMARNGAPVQYLAIANEPDWPHEQPGYFLSPEAYAELFKVVGDYLAKMGQQQRDVPVPKLVGPNTLSAPDAAKRYVPELMRKAGGYLAVIASHDYDMRGDRWNDLQKLAKGRPVWMTEWCSRHEDSSPGQIKAATEYGMAMHDVFNGGANVFMAYDWAYPPRKGGEALVHIDWGNNYELKKPYWLFRQWAEPLVPGMRVVDTNVNGPGASKPGEAGIKPTGFLSRDGRTLVLHVVNAQDKEAPITITATGALAAITSATRRRTSATEDDTTLAPLERSAQGFADTLPARSMVTYILGGAVR
jgi:glucuronoarabinoxylan endo-1,4-beta-xylanase